MPRKIDTAEVAYFTNQVIRWEAMGSGYMKWYDNFVTAGKSYKVHSNIHPTSLTVNVTETKYSEFQKKIVNFTRPVTSSTWDQFHIRYDETGDNASPYPIYFWYSETGVWNMTPAQKKMRNPPLYLKELKTQADKHAKAFVAGLPQQT